MKRRILVAICALAAAGIAGEPNAIDATAAFSRLKSLAGEWKSAKNERLSIELIAGGTSLVERESAEDQVHGSKRMRTNA